MKKTLILISLLAASVASAETWSSTFDFTTATGSTVVGTDGITATISPHSGEVSTSASGWDTDLRRYNVSFGDHKLDVTNGQTITITLTGVTFVNPQNNQWPVLFTLGDGSNNNVKVSLVDAAHGTTTYQNTSLAINGENKFSNNDGNKGNPSGTPISGVNLTNTYDSLTFTMTQATDGGYDFTLSLDGTTTTYHTTADFAGNQDNLTLCIGGRLDSANNNCDMTIKGMTISVTPEPTTATLSLLALAGLCARRRRK